jgi:hypothetical protein
VDLDEALSYLLGDGRTGDLPADLEAAAREAWDRRHRNTEAGAAVLGALLDPAQGKWTFRQLEARIGIPPGTAHRWARRPEDDQ